MSKETYNQIILGALENKPLEVQAGVEAALGEKIVAAVEAKRQEIAQTMFNGPEDTETEDSDWDFDDEDFDLDDFDLDSELEGIENEDS